MAKTSQELEIYQRQVDTVRYAYNILKKYPNHEKYSIVLEIRQTLFAILEMIITTNKTYNNKERLRLMNLIDAKLDYQRILVRISHENKYINNNNYLEWERKISEIGRLLGGWIKSTCQKEKEVYTTSV